MMGTRGVPARYGGFETAVEEIGRRLVEMGHIVTVYCRKPDGESVPSEYLGMRLVTLPALRLKSFETLSHTGFSALRSLVSKREDAVFLFNSANAPFLPIVRRRGARVAVHVDGLEWRRAKWSGLGASYYRVAESLSARCADALIADAVGIADYYREEFDASTVMIPYGAPILENQGSDRLEPLGLVPGQFHLVVARFEPENHVLEIVKGYVASDASHPLIVVGGAPYSDDYVDSVTRVADGDSRVRLVGPIWDQTQLDQLYAHALLYLHGHSVGGTNPSLLRAMGGGAPVAAFDVRFNREVIGDTGRFFDGPASIAAAIETAEADPADARDYGDSLRARASSNYRWDDVAAAYEALAISLAKGASRRGESTGRRLAHPAWGAPGTPAEPSTPAGAP